MKKQLLLLAVCIVTAVAASATGRNDTRIRNWSVPAAFTSISVSNDIDIVLAESSSQTISIEGKSRFVDAVKLEIVNGELKISGCRGAMCGKVRVYVPVSKLQAVVVKGASEVYSMGVLNSPSLRIRVEGHCLVSVRNKGAVVIENDYGYEIEYHKNNQFKLTEASL